MSLMPLNYDWICRCSKMWHDFLFKCGTYILTCEIFNKQQFFYPVIFHRAITSILFSCCNTSDLLLQCTTLFLFCSLFSIGMCFFYCRNTLLLETVTRNILLGNLLLADAKLYRLLGCDSYSHFFRYELYNFWYFAKK